MGMRKGGARYVAGWVGAVVVNLCRLSILPRRQEDGEADIQQHNGTEYRDCTNRKPTKAGGRPRQDPGRIRWEANAQSFSGSA